ncbi:hypothetical protein M0804_015196 [Polistes exclamans]|nr:hypothetical protein M0804_015196 [Polistes exclamans]
MEDGKEERRESGRAVGGRVKSGSASNTPVGRVSYDDDDDDDDVAVARAKNSTSTSTSTSNTATKRIKESIKLKTQL